MKKLLSSCFILTFLVYSLSLYGQYRDCDIALAICGESPFYFSAPSGEGNVDNDVSSTCVDIEFNSTWIKWTAATDGLITFVLTPDNSDQDLDFILFYMNEENNCDNKTLIRCMASGANVNEPPSQWAQCAGPTGLIIWETDVIENAGCSPTDNNFLAPLSATAGDQYMLLVNSFATPGPGFTLDFGGTAELECITVSTTPVEQKVYGLFDVYPTVSNGTIYIQPVEAELTDATMTIYDMTGHEVLLEKTTIEKMHPIDVSFIPMGAYLITIRTAGALATKMFFITH